MPSALRIVLVDDEPLALQRMCDLLAAVPDVLVAGTAHDASSAVAVIESSRADAVFLDVQMPGASGFDVIDALGPSVPLIVFVTAHDDYALKAFQHGVFDYITKPVDSRRLSAVIARVKKQVASLSQDDRRASIDRLLGELSALMPARRRLPVRSPDGKVTFLNVASIEKVEVDDGQLRLTIGKAVHRTRMPLTEFEARIPPGILMRVHRSIMVNLEFIKEIQPYLYGDYAIVLRDGSHVISGRTYREQVRALFEGR